MQKSRTTWTVILLCVLVAAVVLAVPMYVIRPFVPQDASALALALRVRFVAPWVSLLCLLVAAGFVVWAWSSLRWVSRVVLMLLVAVLGGAAAASRVNIFEVMFKPYPSPQFVPASEAKVDADDMVLAVTQHGASRAYPVRSMGYHHIVNDTVGGVPVAITYCTLCHTGLVWSRIFNGQTLTFRLAGINNGNALLRDEQSNTIWQQSTGEGIYGPHKGERLTMLGGQELSFATWKAEQPNGMVLKPNATYEAEYDPKDWDKRIVRRKVVVDVSRSGLDPHVLMLGVHAGSAAKAYPLKTALDARLIQDHVGGTSMLLVVGADGASVRAFDATLRGEPEALTFVRSGSSDDALLTDAETGSTWNFQGCAISGKYVGRCLTPVESHKSFWFDWLNHNPSTQRMQ